MTKQCHEVDLSVYSIEAIRAFGSIWVFIPYDQFVSVGDTVIIYAGARSGEFLHPSVFACTVVEIDQTIAARRTKESPLHDRALVRLMKPLAAIAL